MSHILYYQSFKAAAKLANTFVLANRSEENPRNVVLRAAAWDKW